MADGAQNESAAIQELDPLLLMQRVADQTVQLVPGAEGAMVGLSDGGFVRYVCGAGWLGAHVGTRTAIQASLSGLAIRSGQVLRCDDTETDPRVDRDACRRLNVRSVVCVPLIRAKETVGVLAVSSPVPGAFHDGDVGMLDQMAELIGVAIGLAGDLARVSSQINGFAETRAAVDGDEANDAGARFLMNVLNPDAVTFVDVRRQIQAVLDAPAALDLVFQPIIDLRNDDVVAVEALSRFRLQPLRPPDTWFEEAGATGFGVDLEMLAVEKALGCLRSLPDDLSMSINAGPETILSERFFDALVEPGIAQRVVIELTEHRVVNDYPGLMTAIMRLRRSGARLAVDDTGAGFASLAHILKLAPDFIKLDRELVGGIDVDPVRGALATALVAFAKDTGAEILAEGVETQDELEVVRDLGITYAQGYLIGRPAPLSTVVGNA